PDRRAGRAARAGPSGPGGRGRDRDADELTRAPPPPWRRAAGTVRYTRRAAHPRGIDGDARGSPGRVGSARRGMPDKVATMHDAIAALVRDADTVAIEGF